MKRLDIANPIVYSYGSKCEYTMRHRLYGSESTSLRLTKKAAEAYGAQDWASIYELEYIDYDTQETYLLYAIDTGDLIEYNAIDEEEVNRFFEDLFDECNKEERGAMKVKIFPSEPDYVFGSDEIGKTVLVWPADKDFPDGDSPVHYRTLHESAGIIDFVVFGYPIPEDGEQYEEIMANVSGAELITSACFGVNEDRSVVAEADSIGELRRMIEAKAREIKIDPAYLIW